MSSLPNTICQKGNKSPQSSFLPAWVLQPVWQRGCTESTGDTAARCLCICMALTPSQKRSGPRCKGAAATRHERFAPTISHSSCSAASQPPQTWKPSSLCLLLISSRFPGFKRELSWGYLCQKQAQENGKGWFLLPARLSAREALALSTEPGSPGASSRTCLGQRKVPVLFWTPLLSLQSGCFPSKQHCSTRIRKDLQCREKPPTRHSAACGLRAELGAAVPLCFNCLGSTALLLTPSGFGCLTACSGSVPGSGTLSLPGGLMTLLLGPS